ncbi:MAG: uroporphyrinogen decarboxylase family protein, partial [Desulfobacterales bacterium]
GVGSFTDWMCVLLTEKQYVHELFDYQSVLCVKTLEKYTEALGGYVDVIGISGNDLGTQRCELMSPDLFHELYVPYYKRINDWIHEHTNMKTFFHSCGSIYNIMEALIECGVDITYRIDYFLFSAFQFYLAF